MSVESTHSMDTCVHGARWLNNSYLIKRQVQAGNFHVCLNVQFWKQIHVKTMVECVTQVTHNFRVENIWERLIGGEYWVTLYLVVILRVVLLFAKEVMASVGSLLTFSYKFIRKM